MLILCTVCHIHIEVSSKKRTDNRSLSFSHTDESGNVDRCQDKIHSVFHSVSCRKLNENNEGKHLIAQSNLMYDVHAQIFLLFYSLPFFAHIFFFAFFFLLNFHELIQLFKIRIVKALKVKYIQK